MRKVNKLIATPPGYTVLEQMEIYGITKEELSRALHLNAECTDKFLNGDLPLIELYAMRLERLLGVPTAFWLNLEAIYRMKLKRGAKKRD